MAETHYITGEELFRQLRLHADITVPTLDERDGIKVWQRRWKMIVGVYNDPTPSKNGHYSLEYDKASVNLGDNDNWELLSSSTDKHVSFNINNKQTEIIGHDLGKNPAVSIMDESGALCMADITYIDENTVQIDFEDWFTGIVVFN